MSQGALAELTGLSQGTISQLEARTRRLTHIDRVREVLSALQVPEGISPLGARPPGEQMEWESPADVALRLTDTLATNTDPGVLEVFSTAVQDVISRYDILGPAVLAPELVRLRRQLQRLVDGHQPPVLRTGLFRLAGQIAALLAYMAVNADRRPLLSDAYTTEALALAAETGDLDLIMWIHGTRSLRHYYADNYTQACRQPAPDSTSPPTAPRRSVCWPTVKHGPWPGWVTAPAPTVRSAGPRNSQHDTTSPTNYRPASR
jgi:transcriptional regulator with XRE-family HTH domain